MSQFKVNTQGLRSVVNDEESFQKQIENIYDQVICLKNSISFKVGATRSIRNRLNNVSNGIQGECQTLKRMQDRLAQTADRYEKTENTICDVVKDGKVTKWDKIRTSQLTEELGKTARDAALDILSSFGYVGGTYTWLMELIKIVLDNDGVSAEDIGNLIGGVGDSAISIWELAQDDSEVGTFLKKLFGLDTCETIVTDSNAAWFQNAGSTFKGTFFDELGIDENTKNIKGAKIAGWAVSFIANGFSNYDEYQKGDITAERAVAETFMETGVDIVTGAAITAAVAAGAAALGFAAPAVVVAGAGIVISAGLDFVCKKITGAVLGEEKGLTETISDAVLDLGENLVSGVTNMANEAGKAITGAWSSVKETFCGWGKALGFA